MKKFAKLAMAGILVASAIAGVGCASSDKAADKPAATEPAKKDDSQKQAQAAFAAALIAESQLADQFATSKGLKDGKEVSISVPKKSTEEAAKFLGANYWSEELAKKEFEAVLADKAALDLANAQLLEKAKADKKEADFKPKTAVADKAKLGANALTGAKFEEAKVTAQDGKFIVEYKGLKYTLEKNNASYRVVAKEGTLQK